MSQSLTLFVDRNFFSPYAMFAYVALREKGLPFAIETIDLTTSAQQQPDYLEMSMTARVPTLLHHHFALSESSAIIEYLEELFPAPGHPALLPSEPQARARARQLQAWLRSDLLPLREDRPSTVIFAERSAQPLSPPALASTEKLLRVAGGLIQNASSCVLGKWSIVDTELALMLQRLVTNGDPVPAVLAGYAARQWARPSVQAWLRRDGLRLVDWSFDR